MSQGPEQLQAKEGVVLDREGNTVFAPRGAAGADPREQGHGAGLFGARAGTARIRVYRGAWWLPIALGVGIPTLFVAGMFFFTVLMTIGIALVLLRALFGSRARGGSPISR